MCKAAPAELRALLGVLKFSADRDRLWFVGDVVNRGPQSLQCLRLIRALGDNAVVVLGNHDLHLLALAFGSRLQDKPGDTLRELLRAPDRLALLQWLLERPLAHQDPAHGELHDPRRSGAAMERCAQTLSLAQEVQAALRDRSGGFPRPHVRGQARPVERRAARPDRLRFIVNA